MANTLAADLVERVVAKPRAVAIRCGGLPQRPRGPLGYQLVFAIEGLTIQLAWVVFFMIASRFTFHFGVKRYSAFGG